MAAAANPAFELIRALSGRGVLFIVIGGTALELHGSGYTTQDIDFLYERSNENAQRLVDALRPFDPRLRAAGEDSGVPFLMDARTILNGDNFTLQTQEGYWFDLLGIIAPGWRYQDVERLGYVQRNEVTGLTFQSLTLRGIRETKAAANRVKDRLALPEIDAMIEAEEMRAKLSDEQA